MASYRFGHAIVKRLWSILDLDAFFDSMVAKRNKDAAGRHLRRYNSFTALGDIHAVAKTFKLSEEAYERLLETFLEKVPLPLKNRLARSA